MDRCFVVSPPKKKKKRILLFIREYREASSLSLLSFSLLCGHFHFLTNRWARMPLVSQTQFLFDLIAVYVASLQSMITYRKNGNYYRNPCSRLRSELVALTFISNVDFPLAGYRARADVLNIPLAATLPCRFLSRMSEERKDFPYGRERSPRDETG